MTTAKVQISVSLLEKLAGIKREPQQRQQQQHAPQRGLPFGLPVLPHELAAPLPLAGAGDSGLQQAIRQSQRVGALLLKAEEAEVALVRQRANELVGQYAAEPRPLACGAEQQAALECYRAHPKDVLQCAQLVDAYAACAQAAAGQLMS